MFTFSRLHKQKKVIYILFNRKHLEKLVALEKKGTPSFRFRVILRSCNARFSRNKRFFHLCTLANKYHDKSRVRLRDFAEMFRTSPDPSRGFPVASFSFLLVNQRFWTTFRALHLLSNPQDVS